MGNIHDLVRRAHAEGRVLRIAYFKYNASCASIRDIEVYAFDGFYIDAFCRLRKDMRVFRQDRIWRATLLKERYQRDSWLESLVQLSGWAVHEPKPPQLRAC